jgi:hypothetical protein
MLLTRAARGIRNSNGATPFDIPRILPRSRNGEKPLPWPDTIILMICSSIALFLTSFRERGFSVQE